MNTGHLFLNSIIDEPDFKMLILDQLEGKCLHLYFVIHILTRIHEKDLQCNSFLDSICQVFRQLKKEFLMLFRIFQKINVSPFIFFYF